MQDAKTANQIAEEIAALYDRATNSILRENMLLYFAYADYEEERMKFEKVHAIYEKYIALPNVDPTLAYILYMKFVRRVEGIKSTRTVFRKAREDARSKCQVYVAAALMEYYCSKVSATVDVESAPVTRLMAACFRTRKLPSTCSSSA